jgi:hypothetical protein
MSDFSKKQHPKIRTFANDLNEQRNKNKTGVEKQEILKEIPIKDKVVFSETKKETLQETLRNTVLENQSKPIKTDIVFSEKTSKPNTKIPAFHDLQKQIKLSNEKKQDQIITTVPTTAPIKIGQSSSKKHTKPNIGYDATIITDTKSERFKLLPAVIASIKSWFQNINLNHKKKSTPKFSLPETNRRKGVIQKATSKTGIIFTADNETLKEQIRKRRQQDEERRELKTSWSPFTEVGANLLEAPDQENDNVTQNVVVEFSQPKIFVPPVPANNTEAEKPKNFSIKKEVPEIKIITPTKNSPQIGYENYFADTSSETRTPESPVDTKETKVESETWSNVPYEGTTESVVAIPKNEIIKPIVSTPEKVDEENETEIVAPEEEINVVTSETTKEEDASLDLLKIKTNTLTLILLIIIIGIIAVLFSVKIIYQQLSIETTSEINDETETKSIIKNAQLIKINLTTKTSNKIPELLNSTINSGPLGLVEISIQSASTSELLPADLFAFLKFDTTPSFEQAITSFRFASFDHSKPILVMKFTDENVVRGGLLNWEKNLLANTKSFYDREIGLTGKFTDERINDTEVRLLKQNSETLLVYGIINKNTILITSTVSDFTQISETDFSD